MSLLTAGQDLAKTITIWESIAYTQYKCHGYTFVRVRTGTNKMYIYYRAPATLLIIATPCQFELCPAQMTKPQSSKAFEAACLGEPVRM